MKPIPNYRTTAMAALVLMFTSCSQTYYIPNVQTVPLFTEKNEIQAAVSSSFSENATSTDVSVAYSPGSHLGVFGSFAGGSWTKGDNFSTQQYMRFGSAEAAVGYFTPIDLHGVFEIYGGGGLASQHHQYLDSVSASFKNTKIFIQPVIGYKTAHFQVGFSCRVSYLKFTEENTTFIGEGVPLKKEYVFLEPAFTLRAGGRYAKFQFQRQLVTPFSVYKQDIAYTSLYSFGFQLSLNVKRKATEK